ncbi:MAG: amino acid permease [Holosporaceae bacterium]|jgi:APA family basic amino acid/polyamine antiporter|nr:amino acid permease [Holosporaceae bacterium]
MSQKMGFKSVFAIVFGGQVGSGIFMLPATLAPYGIWAVFGWLMAGLGAVLLAVVFGELCSRFPNTGGPHAYVKETFGQIPSFFVGWCYWLVSWISTSVVIVASIAYLNPFMGDISPLNSLLLEITLLVIITAINCKSVGFAGKTEFLLMMLKFVPFIIVPVLIIPDFNCANITTAADYAHLSPFKLLSAVTVLCLWGFIGLECATTPAGSVQDPAKTIPRAIILGTCAVALVYFINSIAIMGVIPGKVLAASKAPFADAVSIVAGKNISLLLSLAASIVCAGTVNAWVLTSAQASLGLAQDGLLPRFLAKKNSEDSPYVGVLICCFGTIVILALTKNESISEQVSSIINFSVMAFLMVYTICCAAFLKIMLKERKIGKLVIGVFAMAFCLLTMADASWQPILISALFFASGIFVLPFLSFRKI